MLVARDIRHRAPSRLRHIHSLLVSAVFDAYDRGGRPNLVKGESCSYPWLLETYLHALNNLLRLSCALKRTMNRIPYARFPAGSNHKSCGSLLCSLDFRPLILGAMVILSSYMVSREIFFMHLQVQQRSSLSNLIEVRTSSGISIRPLFKSLFRILCTYLLPLAFTTKVLCMFTSRSTRNASVSCAHIICSRHFTQCLPTKTEICVKSLFILNELLFARNLKIFFPEFLKI